jgi:hypothetical protein
VAMSNQREKFFSGRYCGSCARDSVSDRSEEICRRG